MEDSKFNWPAIVYLVGVPLLALLLLPLALHRQIFTPLATCYMLLHFSVDCMSITMGYHRFFSHRSFRVKPFLRYVGLILGAGTFQNSALIWATDHRIHHREIDSVRDPYSIKKGFLWAHFLWMFYKGETRDVPPDLIKDPAVLWQHRNYLALAFAMGWLFPIAVGFSVGQPFGFFYMGVLLRLVLSGHCTFLINSAAHVIGTRPFSISNSARDNWFLSLFTFGEGYHNYHHKFQADYRNGVQWYAWDPTKWTIYLWSKLGLIYGLVRTSPESIETARREVKAARFGEANDKILTR